MMHHFGTWNLDISLGPVELQERGHCCQECKRIQTIQEMSPTRQHHQVSCWCWVVVGFSGFDTENIPNDTCCCEYARMESLRVGVHCKIMTYIN